MEIGTLVSLALYFIAMLGIGLYAYRTSTDDVSGYMLGGRKLSPGLTALSAGASDMSGWLLMGLPGAVFISGFSNMWLGLGLFLGAFANYILVAPRSVFIRRSPRTPSPCLSSSRTGSRTAPACSGLSLQW